MFGMRLWEWHSLNCERVAEPNPTGIVPSIIAMITEIRSSAATGDNHDPHTKVKVWGSWFWALYQFIRNRANPKTPPLYRPLSTSQPENPSPDTPNSPKPCRTWGSLAIWSLRLGGEEVRLAGAVSRGDVRLVGLFPNVLGGRGGEDAVDEVHVLSMGDGAGSVKAKTPPPAP